MHVELAVGTMGAWQQVFGRLAATAGRVSSRNLDRIAKGPDSAAAQQLLLPFLVGFEGQWNRAAEDLSLFKSSTDHGRKQKNGFLLGIPAMLVLTSGTRLVEAEEKFSSGASPHPESSILNDAPVLHLADESLRESQPGEAASNSHTAKWRIFTDMGRDLFSKGRLDEAEKYFLQALEEAKQGFGEKDPHVASSCNNLAELHRMKREYVKSEPLFLEAVQRLEEAFSPDHESVGFALHNLAGTYLVQRKFDLARQCYERSLKIKERKLGQNHPEYANTLFHLGEVLRLQGNYKDAEELIRDSIRILEDGGVGHSQIAIRRMGRLVEILTRRGELQEAENLQRKVLHVLELSQGLEATSTTMAAENLAGTLQAIGNLKEAEELLQRCFQVRQRILPPSHIQLGVTMFKLASVMIQRGDELASSKVRDKISDASVDYESAEELLHRAIRIAERSWKGLSGASRSMALQAGSLISLLRSLDALGRLKIRRVELARTPEEVEEGTKEAERCFRQCLSVLDKSDLPKELVSVPEIQRQHIACLRHLAGLLSSALNGHRNATTKTEVDQLLNRSEIIEADLRSNKTIKV